ncbi:MAG: serine hydrolase [Veillonella sp.]|jgi:beta-lactamase class A
MWNILGRQQFRDILPFYWGEDTRFHHKTGSLDRVEHDGGVLETFRGHFCFILLMSDIDNDRGKELGAQVGRIMKEFVEEALP